MSASAEQDPPAPASSAGVGAGEIDEVATQPAPEGALDRVVERRPGPMHPDRVRQLLAFALVALLAVVVSALLYGWLRGREPSEIEQMMVALGPLVTLVAGVVGFYFGDSSGSR